MKDTSLNKLAWLKLKKNKLAYFSLCYIVLLIFVALFVVIVSPDTSPNANEMHLEIAKKKPLTKITFLQIPVKRQVQTSFFQSVFIGKERIYKRIPIDYYKILDYKKANSSSCDSSIRALEDLYGNSTCTDPLKSLRADNKILLYSEYGSNKRISYVGDYQIISQKFWLGTDKFGRDYLSRILHGTRISLSVGFISVFISLLIGITLGLIAGYFRGKTDNLIMWLVNIIWSIPTLLMVIAITLALGKGFWQVFVAIGLTMWVEVARVVRGQVLISRELEYVEAGKVLAYKSFRIIFKHILPNIIGPVIVISAANFASAILIESGLSFLGIGAQPPVASWGNMIKDHYSYIIMNKAYLAVIPGLAIMSLVLAFMLLGNGLREVFNVKK